MVCRKTKELSKEWLKKAANAALIRGTTAEADSGDVEAVFRIAQWNDHAV